MLSSIGFIPDGNRRFAREHRISTLEAYRMGTRKAWQTIGWLQKYPQIKTGCFYTLSLKNLARKKHELRVLHGIFRNELKKVTDTDYFDRNGIRLKFIGRLNELPGKMQSMIHEAEEATAHNTKKLISLALGYDGQAEIVDAAKQLAIDYHNGKIDLQDIDEGSFSQYLYSQNQPDLIVRTSGEQRLSGFLPYQSTYSELYFCDKFWPEFEASDLARAVREFNSRKINLGK